jgi:glutamine synthetase
MLRTADDLLREARDKGVEFLSFCFADFAGKMHRMTYHLGALNNDMLEQGVGFDGSSIAAWKEIHNSDCLIVPDLTTVFEDPFSAQKCFMVLCDVIDPQTGRGYLRDPRSVAKCAQRHLLDTGIADVVNVGPEMEFFVFDAVDYELDAYSAGYKLSSSEIGGDKSGHRPMLKGGYCPAQPIDHLFDIRAEMCKVLQELGMQPTLHHHEVAGAQCEIGFKYSSLLGSADNVQKFKYIAKNVAASFGKTLTFMPKPIVGDNGSGMHTHFSLSEKGNNIFYEEGAYADLSELSLFFIGGIIKHGHALNAFTNPTTNSYKRLVAGYEAPINLAYSACNRSAAIRIPYSKGSAAKRVEIRFPDPACNPYLAFAAMLMAGLDGIHNRIHPGEAVDVNLYLPQRSTSSIKTVCVNLEEALDALQSDSDFLKAGGVFSDDVIEAYIQHKRQESSLVADCPHPMEFKLYYAS